MELRPGMVGALRSSDFLGKECTCECGKIHSVSIEKILIEKGAIGRIPKLLQEFGYKKVFLMADGNTYLAAGKAVEKALQGQFIVESLVYQRVGDLVPDEKAVGEFFIRFTPDAEVIIAIGTGVLNDLAKYVSHKVQVPYIIVATAPSMDGFASDAAALIVDNVKVSYPARNAQAIIGDTDVLQKAPMNMISAGLGDMLGKYSALRDWKLGTLIEKEYYCEIVVNMVETAVQRCIDGMDGLRLREDKAIANLMEGLVLTGIAMSFAGNSRPASGSEHHISHFWEMMYLLEGKEAVLHGTKVGIASVVISKLAARLASQRVDWEQSLGKAKAFDAEQWKSEITEVYKKSAPGIITLSESGNRHSLADRLARIETIRKNWQAVVELLQAGPSPLQLESLLKQMGAPVKPSDIGIDKNHLYNGILYSKEIRTRYSILQLLGDIGLLDEYASVGQQQYF